MTHLAFCGPVSLKLLSSEVEDSNSLPVGYACPLMSYLIRALLIKKVKVTVVTSCVEVAQTREWNGERLTVVATPRRSRGRFYLDGYRHEVRTMSEVLKGSQADLVHAQWTYEFAESAIRSGLPYLVTAHDSPWTVACAMRQWHRFYRAIYSSAFVFPKIKHLTCVSPYLLQVCARHHRMPADTRVIPNGVDPAQVVRDARLRVSDPARPRFVAVSGTNRRKNIAPLLAAFSKVVERIPGATLDVFGDGLGAEDCFPTRMVRRGFAQGVRFLGVVPHGDVLAHLESKADVFVNTSLEESFCMVVLEAMAKGLPVIGGGTSGGVPYLLDNGEAGCVTDVRSPDQVADAMLSLVANSGLFRNTAAAGLVRVKAMFTLDRVADQYLACYRDLLRGS